MSAANLNTALKSYFGFDEFREPQESIVRAIVEGKDAMVIMPTGGGKSLCYQLPALLLPGVTLVISPLIALMKDQVEALRNKGIPAEMLNSSMNADAQRQALDSIAAGRFKLVYVAPERFRSSAFVRAIGRARISLVAVDEAHCLSQWGHDFRPDYLRVGAAIEQLGRPTLAAFTATATPEVREDIRTHLKLREPAVFVSGFARANLSFRIAAVAGEEEKYSRLLKLAQEHRTGIVYCATRKRVEQVAAVLFREGLKSVTQYHAGLSDEERDAAQNRFMRGESDVVVATNAFGMGIDRSDIRFVAHFEMPGSVEAYYQEAGRAGRDGRPSVCELFFSYADKRIQDFFIEGSNPSRGLLEKVYATLLKRRNEANCIEIPIDELKEALNEKVNPMAVSTSLSVLARHQYIERYDIPGKRIRGTRLLRPDVSPHQLELDWASLQVKMERDENKLRAVIQLAYARSCRQEWILQYFGERVSHACGCCDQCKANMAADGTLRAGTPEEATILRKALSGVARMSNRISGHRWEARFGRARIEKCLLGSLSEQVTSVGLDKLSTFGLLKPEGRRYLSALFDEMEARGLIERVEGNFPLCRLTVIGSQVMLGEAEVALNWPVRTAGGAADKKRKRSRGDSSVAEESPAAYGAAPPAYDEKLYSRLKQKRAQLAAARGGVPQYVILSNRALQHLASARPKTPEEAIDLPDIGEVKARKVVPSMLKIIRIYELKAEMQQEA